MNDFNVVIVGPRQRRREPQSLRDDGIDVIRGFGTITGPGTVEVGGRTL